MTKTCIYFFWEGRGRAGYYRNSKQSVHSVEEDIGLPTNNYLATIREKFGKSHFSFCKKIEIDHTTLEKQILLLRP
jgi:hypothetical protein